MEFTASDKYIYAGDSAKLTCTVRSSSPDYPLILLSDGSNLPQHTYEEIDVDKYTVSTKVLLREQSKNKVDYMCVLDSEEDEEKLEQELSIFSYGMSIAG